LAWPQARADQPAITATCLVGWLRLADPSYLPPGRYARLEALAAHWEGRAEFAATRPADYAIPRSA
ncbi:MAG: hypothetical protein KGO51_17490, partial [Alphaproteobacteria bacterium]|nr:hypothetical protein [Alphaproteobacteria bacterium]